MLRSLKYTRWVTKPQEKKARSRLHLVTPKERGRSFLDEVLAKVAIEDVWGIGHKYSLFLMNHGILSAKDLKYVDEKWIRRYLTVIGERIVFELRGTACIPLVETERPTKKGFRT